MTAPRVWVVSELYYPEQTSTGYFLTGIAEGLARFFDVGAICGQPTYSERHLTAPWREVRNGVRIERCRGSRLNRHNVIARAINVATLSTAMFMRLLRVLRRGHVVVAVTNPPGLPWLALLACKLRGSRCVVLVHDVYPEVLAATGLVREDALFYRALNGLVRVLYKRADAVVVIGRDMLRLVAAKRETTAGVSLIPNWADVEDVAPAPSGAGNALRDGIGLTDHFVVQYSGNIGRTHDLDLILDAAAALAGDPDIRFMIVGSGAQQARVVDELQRRRLNNVHLMSPVPRSELSTLLNAANVAVITMRPGMAGVSVPSRMYNIMAAGRAIIASADDDSEIAAVIRESRIGWVVRPADVAQFVSAIRAAKDDRAGLADMGARSRQLVESRYTRAHVVDAFIALLRQMVA